MADLAVPTGSTATVANVADLWHELAGSAPDTASSTPGEQNIIFAIHGSYYDALQKLALRGYSVTQIHSALAGSLLVPHIYVSFCATLHADIELDASRVQVIEFYCRQWDDALKGAAVLYDASDPPELIEPDPSSTAAADLQANETTRNGTAGDNHDFVFDWHYSQFGGRPAVLERYAGSLFGNTRDGS